MALSVNMSILYSLCTRHAESQLQHLPVQALVSLSLMRCNLSWLLHIPVERVYQHGYSDLTEESSVDIHHSSFLSVPPLSAQKLQHCELALAMAVSLTSSVTIAFSFCSSLVLLLSSMLLRKAKDVLIFSMADSIVLVAVSFVSLPPLVVFTILRQHYLSLRNFVEFYLLLVDDDSSRTSSVLSVWVPAMAKVLKKWITCDMWIRSMYGQQCGLDTLCTLGCELTAIAILSIYGLLWGTWVSYCVEKYIVDLLMVFCVTEISPECIRFDNMLVGCARFTLQV
jgi:hypothetical protein